MPPFARQGAGTAQIVVGIVLICVPIFVALLGFVLLVLTVGALGTP
jgi:hypothetical protein